MGPRSWAAALTNRQLLRTPCSSAGARQRANSSSETSLKLHDAMVTDQRQRPEPDEPVAGAKIQVRQKVDDRRGLSPYGQMSLSWDGWVEGEVAVAGRVPEDTAATRARRFRHLASGMGTWRWRTTTALPAAQVERIIADWAESAVTSRRTGIPPVRRHRDGALYVRRPLWRWGDHFRLTVQPASTGSVILVEQRFYLPAVVSNAIVALYLGGALTGNPFTHDLWTRSPQTRLAMWVLSGLLTCLAFRLATELLRRSDRKDFGYWLSLSVQAHDMAAWRRWQQAS